VDEISPSKTTSLLEKKAKRNVSCITTQKTTTAIHNKRKRSQSRLFPISPVEEIGLRILIVDDNPINLNILKKSLHILFKKIKRLEEATNGVEALNLVNLHLFDIILMDIDMPLLNGVETAKHIRKSNTTIPIIAVTTKDSIESRNLYKEIGMVGVDQHGLMRSFILLTLLIRMIASVNL
jgi:CheY-like chemotaxis protein